MKRKVVCVVCILIGLAMTVQIALGVIWMGLNLTNIPAFGDTTEYYQLSQTLQVDEYRPILYPLMIRGADMICRQLSIGYQTILYLVQTAVSFGSILYLTCILGKIITGKSELPQKFFRSAVIFVSAYIMCIPMITFMNFSVLTDSIATSMLLFAIGAIVQTFYGNKPLWRGFLVIAVSMLIEFLVRADRLYSCTLFLLICFVAYLIKKRKGICIRRTVAWMVVCILFCTGAATAANGLTQQPGLYGRIRTTFGFVLLDRVVWPNMTENYEDFPQEIKDMVSKEDAETFDSHNNNVMYQMAPLIREKAGEEQAEEIYKDMAKIVFHNQPLKVLSDIVEDIICVIFTPISAYLSRYGNVQTADSWNLYCVSRTSETFSNIYYAYYLNSFMSLLVIACLCFALRLFRRERGAFTVSKLLAPGFLMCLIIALWFSIGDGAPPNDRYALLHYVIWAYWALGNVGKTCLFNVIS